MLKYEVQTKKFADLKSLVQIPKFQRSLVWNDEKKRAFITTLKKGLPIGVLLLSEKNGSYLIVDGLQRFTTMKDYSHDIFRYVDPAEITDTDITSIIIADKKGKQWYDNLTATAQELIKQQIRDIIVSHVRNSQGINLFNLTTSIASEINNQISILSSNDIQGAIYTIVENIKTAFSIDDVEIPLIIYKGDESELADIFQKLNQEGVKLSKYDIFAATWINHCVTVHDANYIQYIIKKYDDAQEKSNLEIANYNPDEMKKNGSLTVYEYAFALGKHLQKAAPSLLGDNKSDTKVEGMGFLLLAELMGLSYAEMGKLADKIEEYKKKLDFDALSKALYESAEVIERTLKDYVTLPTPKTTVISCHSDLQIASYIIVYFKLKYSLTVKDGLLENKSNKNNISNFKYYLPKHYLYDIIRNHWSGSGDSKLEAIINTPTNCRYLSDVAKESFSYEIIQWLKESNDNNGPQIKTETKLFLNYLLRYHHPALDKNAHYDIEHCVPKNLLQKNLVDNGISVPISSPCNLVYIPMPDNRGKGDSTYYQKIKKYPTAYTLDQTGLVMYCYPTESELAFINSQSTFTKDRYLQYLNDRVNYISNEFINALYK